MKKIFALTGLFLSLFVSEMANAQLTADFSMSREKAGVDVEVVFEHKENGNSGLILSYEWSISDGTQFKGLKQFTYAFKKSGTYEVVLLVTDVTGKSAKSSRKIEILDNLAPIADFYIRKGEIVVGQEVVFISQAQDPDGEIESVLWTIKSKTELKFNGQSFLHAFKTAGDYEVQMEVTDNLGQNQSISKKLAVLEINSLPSVEVNLPFKVYTGEETSISIQVADKDGRVEKVFWSLNGAPEVEVKGSRATVIFSLEGRNLLSVKAIDNRGGSSVKTAEVFPIDFKKTPSIELKLSQDKFVVDEKAVFEGVILNEKTKLSGIGWDFGDGKTDFSNGKVVAHSYDKPGIYNVKARWIFEKNASAILEKQVEVIEKSTNRPTATQVVVNNVDYIEIIPTQEINLHYSVFNNNSIIYSYSTPVWHLSNANVQLVSCVYGSCLRGVTPGYTDVTVSVDGIHSQTIRLQVLGFTADGAVTHAGKFIGSRFSNFCYFLNRAEGVYYYKFTNEHRADDVVTYEGEGTDYVGSCDLTYLSTEPGEINFSAARYDLSESFSAKKNLPMFIGRNGFLNFSSSAFNSFLKVNYADDRFVNWDEDFSITYWTVRNYVGYMVLPIIAGKIQTSSGGAWTLSANNSGTYKYFHYPLNGVKDKWVNVALTYKASTGLMSYYLDGRLIFAQILPTPNLTNTNEIRMFAPGSYSTLDELRFWNKELSATEVSDEMFSPQALDSSSLLAAFSFNNGLDGNLASDNGSDWTYSIESQSSVRSIKGMSQPVKVHDSEIVANTQYALEMDMPIEGFSDRKLYLSIGANDFSGNDRLKVEVGSCLRGCVNEQYPEKLRKFRYSPLIYIGPLRNLDYSMVAKIPFDVNGVSSADLKKIKVIYSGLLNPGTEYYVFEPKEVNLIDGYVSVDVPFGGVYWVGIPEDHESMLSTYTNADLKPMFIPSYFARTFYTQIPSAQSSYSLTTSSSPNYNITYATLTTPSSSGLITPAMFFPMSLNSLGSGHNYLDLLYEIYGGTSGVNSGGSIFYYFFDRIIVWKE